MFGLLCRATECSVISTSFDAWCITCCPKREETLEVFEKRQLWLRPMGGWNSTLQAAWYVRHANWARLCCVPFVICNMVFVNYIYDMVVDISSTSFMVGRSRVFYTYSSWKIKVRDYPGCHQGQQDDLTRTMLSIFILRTDTISVSYTHLTLPTKA